MKTKKGRASSITIQTWIIFGIFLVVSIICLKVVFTARTMTDSIVIPTPIVVRIPTVSPIHKAIKK